jgi:hypothetical protein
MEIVNQISDTEREVYRFHTIGSVHVFSGYYFDIKPKGKRKWRIEKHWDRLDNRGSNVPEPNLPDGIRELAMKEAMKYVFVKTWSEYKNPQK